MAQLARPADRPFWPVGLSGPTQLLGQMITRRRAFTSPSVLRSSSLSDLSRLEMQGGAAAEHAPPPPPADGSSPRSAAAK